MQLKIYFFEFCMDHRTVFRLSMNRSGWSVVGEGLMGSFSIWHWLIVLLVVFVSYLPLVLYIRSYQKAAKLVNDRGGDAMEGLAWLLIVPVLSIIWVFFMLLSLRANIRRVRLDAYENDWFGYGIAAGILSVVGGIFSLIFPILSIVSYGLFIVFAIVHWSKIVSLRDRITKNDAPITPHFP